MWYNQPDPDEYFIKVTKFFFGKIEENGLLNFGYQYNLQSYIPSLLPACVTGLINGGKISSKCGRKRIFHPTVTVKGHGDIMSFRFNFSNNGFNNWWFISIQFRSKKFYEKSF